MFILNFWSSQFLSFPRPCNKSRGQKKVKPKSFHQYSWNSEVETTWISLIGWPHKTSSKYVPAIFQRQAAKWFRHLHSQHLLTSWQLHVQMLWLLGRAEKKIRYNFNTYIGYYFLHLNTGLESFQDLNFRSVFIKVEKIYKSQAGSYMFRCSDFLAVLKEKIDTISIPIRYIYWILFFTT
jgi:hypothetical protein